MAGEIQLNSVSLATESSGTVTLNSSTDIKGCINASGSAPIYACRAWINFDGISASIGTGRASGNVSGVTDNGTGDYTVTFATAMPDANYSVTTSLSYISSSVNYSNRMCGSVNVDSSTCKIIVQTYTGASADADEIKVAIFR